MHSTYSIRISKDGCSLAALFLINSQISRWNPSSSVITAKNLPARFLSEDQSLKNLAETNKDLDIPKDQYIALQIDLL